MQQADTKFFENLDEMLEEHKLTDNPAFVQTFKRVRERHGGQLQFLPAPADYREDERRQFIRWRKRE